MERRVVLHLSRNGSCRFPHKALANGEYEPRQRCYGLHTKPLYIIGINISVFLALAWATNVIFPAGGHVFKIRAENTSALSWMKNMARNNNPIVRCLVRFLVAILLSSVIPCIPKGRHIPGEENVGANHISRPTLAPLWESGMEECPTVKLCWRCQVLSALLSALASTISLGFDQCQRRERNECTLDARAAHFLYWPDHIHLPFCTLLGQGPDTVNLTLAVYGHWVGGGNSLRGSKIVATTLAGYLTATVALLEQHGMYDPRRLTRSGHPH
jgi:hypothetical protein